MGLRLGGMVLMRNWKDHITSLCLSAQSTRGQWQQEDTQELHIVVVMIIVIATAVVVIGG
jgi:hypothetical protein